MGAGERIDSGADQIVGGVAVEVTLGLGEGDELGSAVEVVEREDAVVLGEVEVGKHLGRERGAVGLFFEQLGAEDGSLGSFGRGGASGLPAAGGFEVNQRGWDLFFGAAAFGALVADDVADDAIAHNHLVAAVLENEAGAMGRRGVGGDEGALLLERGGEAGSSR